MAEKKAVLNVTVPESMAEAVRHEAAAGNVTISSVVEAALAEQLKWYKIRADGLAAIEEEYQRDRVPTPEEAAAATPPCRSRCGNSDEMLAAELGGRTLGGGRSAVQHEPPRPAGAARAALPAYRRIRQRSAHRDR